MHSDESAYLFKRDHHNRIASVLQSLNSELLIENKCWFAGGTAIVLVRNEYRESVDIVFLVSDLSGYQKLRSLLTTNGLNALTRTGMALNATRDIRADQYGLRTMLKIDDIEIKFEIIYEGRIQLLPPPSHNCICGIRTLTEVDMATSKLLANSDRWSDDSVFSRDLIDLAMLDLSKTQLQEATQKAELAYSDSVRRDLKKAIQQLSKRKGHLDVCISALNINELPKALLWNNIRKLNKI